MQVAFLRLFLLTGVQNVPFIVQSAKDLLKNCGQQAGDLKDLICVSGKLLLILLSKIISLKQ